MDIALLYTLLLILIVTIIILFKRIFNLSKKISNLEKKTERAQLNKDPLDFYDIIVGIDTIKDLVTKGWKISINEKQKEKIEKGANEDKVTIGVIGNRNKGKSFILQKLSNQMLQTGTMINTIGLSLKYYEKYVLLDSAGFESPVLINDIKEDNINELEKDNSYNYILDKSRDKLFTEDFLQNYIIQYSNVLIVVFGILSLSEQKLLIRIKKAYKEILKKQPDKKLIIIHNLQTYETREEINKYIEDVLLKSASFKVKKTKQSFVQKDIDFLHDIEDKSIYHLIYAREGSEAGEFYNDLTLNAIRTMNTMNTYAGKYDYKNTLKEHFKNVSNKFFEFKPNEKFELYEENPTLLKCKNL